MDVDNATTGTRGNRYLSLFSRRKLLLIVGLAAVGLMTISFGRMALARLELDNQAEVIRGQISGLQEENKQLQRDLAYWQSPEGVERSARESLGWAKPGETAVLITNLTPEAGLAPATTPRSREEHPNWRKWWQLFLDE